MRKGNSSEQQKRPRKSENIILLETLRAHFRSKSAYTGVLAKTFTKEVLWWNFHTTINLAAFETNISRAPWISREAPNRIFFFLRTCTGFIINVCVGHTVLSIPHKPAKKEALRVSRSGPPSATPCSSLLLHACSRPGDRNTHKRANRVHTQK